MWAGCELVVVVDVVTIHESAIERDNSIAKRTHCVLSIVREICAVFNASGPMSGLDRRPTALTKALIIVVRQKNRSNEIYCSCETRASAETYVRAFI